jgi:hypothetical protein
MTDEDLRRVLEENFLFLERFARAWQAQAGATDPSLARFVPAGTGETVDISALTFHPALASAVRS